MSDLFEKLGAAAKQTANNVGLQVNIASEQQKIRNAYQVLGKLYYQAVRRGQKPRGPEFDDQVDRIDESCRKIRELKYRKTVVPMEDDLDFIDLD